jgi:hypothetical protein
MTGAISGQGEIQHRSSPDGARIEVHVGDIRQLFNSMDPSPFRERDLDPKAEEYIFRAARELPRRLPLALTVSLTQAPAIAGDLDAVPQAIRDYFQQRAVVVRAELRRLLGTGGWSLLIGLTFVAAANLVGDFMARQFGDAAGYGHFVHESFVIGSWVALWRPLELLLYDWWPLLADVRLYDRLGAMDVEVNHVI